MIEDLVLHAKRQSDQGTLRPLKSLKGTCTKPLMFSDGNTTQTSNPATAPLGEPSSSGPSSDLNVSNQNNQNASDQSGLRRRKASENDEKNDSDKACGNDIKKWIVIALPNKKYKTLEHISVDESREDLSLFREIRNLYKKRRNKWRRVLELHDVYKIHLVKVRVLEVVSCLSSTRRRCRPQPIPLINLTV
jgi:hypothetical protein